MKSILLNSPKKQSGLSLVELMVALLISTILLLGVLELFGSSSKTSRSANALARLQENGRLAMDLIAREARRTGFNGCDGAPDASGTFTSTIGGSIDDFPAQSLKGSTNNSLTFRYYGSSDGVSSNQCNQADLNGKRYYIRFENDGNNIRVISNDTGSDGQILINHAKINHIEYIYPCKDDPTKTCSAFPSNPDFPKKPDGTVDFKNVQKLKVALELCTDTLSESSPKYCSNDSNTKIERTFSSLIELRNRL